MAKVKAWKLGQSGEPAFPADFEVLQKAVLQVTDIKTNRNKYYALELHGGRQNDADVYRVFTHYGRTDDLETNPDSGQKEGRYFQSLVEAQANYQSIYRQKTSPGKGYKELSLAASKIGSRQARGTSSGEVDAKTLDKLAAAKAKQGQKPARLALHPSVRDLVQHLYAEATSALTATVNAKITANGIETPLGVLTVGQIEKGERILAEAYQVFQKKRLRNKAERLEQLSGEFYTVIPHRIGRSRAAVSESVLDSVGDFAEKQETLQLMKDMLQVDGDQGVLYDAEVDNQYRSLNCELVCLESGDDYRRLANYLLDSQIKTRSMKVRQIFQVQRPGERQAFSDHIDNQRLLFHGSRAQNWVGLLSRGVVLPKLAVKLGVHRTDAGWLGHGIYFGDAACTGAFYTSPGRRRKKPLYGHAHRGLRQNERLP